MTVTPYAPTDAAAGEMIVRWASERGVSVEDFVASARAAHRQRRVDEIRPAIRKLDGTRRTRVALLAGITPEQLDAVGGVLE